MARESSGHRHGGLRGVALAVRAGHQEAKSPGQGPARKRGRVAPGGSGSFDHVLRHLDVLLRCVQLHTSDRDPLRSPGVRERPAFAAGARGAA